MNRYCVVYAEAYGFIIKTWTETMLAPNIVARHSVREYLAVVRTYIDAGVDGVIFLEYTYTYTYTRPERSLMFAEAVGRINRHTDKYKQNYTAHNPTQCIVACGDRSQVYEVLWRPVYMGNLSDLCCKSSGPRRGHTPGGPEQDDTTQTQPEEDAYTETEARDAVYPKHHHGNVVSVYDKDDEWGEREFYVGLQQTDCRKLLKLHNNRLSNCNIHDIEEERTTCKVLYRNERLIFIEFICRHDQYIYILAADPIALLNTRYLDTLCLWQSDPTNTQSADFDVNEHNAISIVTEPTTRSAESREMLRAIINHARILEYATNRYYVVDASTYGFIIKTWTDTSPGPDTEIRYLVFARDKHDADVCVAEFNTTPIGVVKLNDTQHPVQAYFI